MAQAKNENLVVVSFYSEAVINQPKSERAGRPIFDDVDMIKFQFAGDARRVCVFPALETDPNASREAGHPISYAESHAEQYRKFRAQEQQTVAGTPLAEAPFLTEAKRRELRALNIHSIEALAALDGPNLKSLGMGGREWKNQASAYLAKAAGSADVTGMAAQLAKLTETVQMLMEENARLAATRPAPIAPIGEDEEGEGGAGAGDGKTEKDLADCSDQELRDFIKAETSKAPPANTGRARLIELATEIASREAA
jgi:hypothetical protein